MTAIADQSTVTHPWTVLALIAAAITLYAAWRVATQPRRPRISLLVTTPPCDMPLCPEEALWRIGGMNLCLHHGFAELDNLQRQEAS